MLRPQITRTRNILDLSGLWDFRFDFDNVGEAEGWVTSVPDPHPIAVPGSWNEQFPEHDQYMDLAWYQTSAFIPTSWRDQELFIHVGSANYAAHVWVNGVFLGEHLGGHLPFAFEMTEAVKWDAANVITIAVENTLKPDRVPPGALEADGPLGFGNNIPPANFDFFPYGGIHRQVTLVALPKTRIEDITVRTDIDGREGIVHIHLQTIAGWSGKALAGLTKDGDTITVQFDVADGVATTALTVPNARLWGPDDPALYALEVSLVEDAGELDHITLDIGIRTFEVRGDQLLLNGEPIFLKGFGKHEDAPAVGRGLNLPLHRQDASLMKWIGANSYRTAHYPYAEEALEIADREGFLIIDEIPAVGLSFNDGDENIRARLDQCKRQVSELIARDKNHPSVVAWSVANEPIPNNMGGLVALEESDSGVDESGGNAFFEELFVHTRSLDDSRPVILVGVMGGSPTAWLELSDFVAINRYFGWYVQGYDLDAARTTLANEMDELHRQHGKPIMVTEFGADTIAGRHSVDPQLFTEEYQSEMIEMYLDVAEERDYVAGMHIWNFADFRTAQGITRVGGFNLKGVFTRDRQPKRAAFMLRDRWMDSE